MVMRNGDVYSIALASKDLILLGVQEAYDLRPLVPVKIDALCGLEIQGWKNACIQLKQSDIDLILSNQFVGLV